ncbi:hypothetical protein [Glutamicibacter sp. BSL13]
MDAHESHLEPAAILRGIDELSASTQRAMGPNTSLLYLLWGAVWLLGFLAFYLAFIPGAEPLLPLRLAGLVTGILVAGAIVFSAVHSARRAQGTRGPSMIQGAVYGNCFALSFILAGLLGWRLAAAGLDAAGLASYALAAACLVIGSLAAVGALIWNDRAQLVTGGWILLVGLLSLALPSPHHLLVGALGGLGMMLIGVLLAARPALVSGPVLQVGHV